MKSLLGIFTAALCVLLLPCCKQSDKPSERDIVKKPELLEDRIRENMQAVIEYSQNHSGSINDTVSLSLPGLVASIYSGNGFNAFWTEKGALNAIGDSLYRFVEQAKSFGLFPSDYHFSTLSAIMGKLESDSLGRKDAALLSRTDLILTDALLNMSRDIKRGRLPYDSLTVRNDTPVIDDNFYLRIFNEAVSSKQIYNTLQKLEPSLPGYTEIRAAIRSFIDTTTFRTYTYLSYPYTDSLRFYAQLKNRLYEEKLFDSLPGTLDTATLRTVLTQYQKSKKLKPTGRINENTVKNLNNTSWEKFKRIALTLDKYKLMPDTLPENYVWVNIPSYNLKVVEGDSIVMESKVIVGTSKTRTPELYSEISNFITYPQWTVPYSIIFKEMLPQIQKDTNYLKKQNLMVVDKNDSVIPPSKINWSKLSKKYFPYLIKQRQGDDNSLGVLKFNFRNKYAVYLHDTNARWMFSKSDRALSHGCVRVQDWEQLAHYLVRNDSIRYHPDTLTSWIVRQEKHVVSGFKKLPLFIRYFTVEGKNGSLKFYEDIYADDKLLTEKYFSKEIY